MVDEQWGGKGRVEVALFKPPQALPRHGRISKVLSRGWWLLSCGGPDRPWLANDQRTGPDGGLSVNLEREPNSGRSDDARD